MKNVRDGAVMRGEVESRREHTDVVNFSTCLGDESCG